MVEVGILLCVCVPSMICSYEGLHTNWAIWARSKCTYQKDILQSRFDLADGRGTGDVVFGGGEASFRTYPTEPQL